MSKDPGIVPGSDAQLMHTQMCQQRFFLLRPGGLVVRITTHPDEEAKNSPLAMSVKP